MAPTAPPSTSSEPLYWSQWQRTPASERLLSAKDRRTGYTVVWVPPPFRGEFLALVQALRLYDIYFHKPKRAMGPAQLDAWRDWAQATQALIQVLHAKD